MLGACVGRVHFSTSPASMALSESTVFSLLDMSDAGEIEVQLKGHSTALLRLGASHNVRKTAQQRPSFHLQTYHSTQSATGILAAGCSGTFYRQYEHHRLQILFIHSLRYPDAWVAYIAQHRFKGSHGQSGRCDALMPARGKHSWLFRVFAHPEWVKEAHTTHSTQCIKA
jgi:hypothetical protein